MLHYSPAMVRNTAGRVHQAGRRTVPTHRLAGLLLQRLAVVLIAIATTVPVHAQCLLQSALQPAGLATVGLAQVVELLQLLQLELHGRPSLQVWLAGCTAGSPHRQPPRTVLLAGVAAICHAVVAAVTVAGGGRSVWPDGKDGGGRHRAAGGAVGQTLGRGRGGPVRGAAGSRVVSV